MTELEKIAYARSFIEKLANGINPLDDTPVPENDIVNNVRLSRCFSYVSDILRQVCESGGVSKSVRPTKNKFGLTLEQREKYKISTTPIAVSEIAKRINLLAEDENMKNFSYKQINQWLVDIGMLYLQDVGTKTPIKRPTEMGNQMGITVEKRHGRNGDYSVVVYNVDAQRFVLDNLDAILATEVKKSATNDPSK